MILNKITALSSACIPVSKPTAETECSAVSVRNLSASLFSFWYYLSCTCSPAFCWSVCLTLRSGRYDQFLVIWKTFPVPASGRFPGSTVCGTKPLISFHTQKTAFPISKEIKKSVTFWSFAPVSQWRDRTGLSPVSLLPAVRPLQGGSSTGCLFNCYRRYFSIFGFIMQGPLRRFYKHSLW